MHCCSAGEDPNLVFERHYSSTDCDPANYARVKQKKKCPVQGCREKLTTINTYTCKACCQAVCLKHRLEGDHKCPGKSGAAAAAAAVAVSAAAAAAEEGRVGRRVLAGVGSSGSQCSSG